VTLIAQAHEVTNSMQVSSTCYNAIISCNTFQTRRTTATIRWTLCWRRSTTLRCCLQSPSTRRASATTTRSLVNYISRGTCRPPSSTSSATCAESTLRRYNATSTVRRSTISTARRQPTSIYVQLFNSEMRRILDVHAPLKTRT